METGSVEAAPFVVVDIGAAASVDVWVDEADDRVDAAGAVSKEPRV